jgi:hypothetical protein
MGSGFNSTVWAVERHNNVIYAGGDFTASGATNVSRIAQFTGGAWVPVGSGLNGQVYAMKSYNGSLYVGGSFTMAGALPTGGLARWDGSWHAVGGFFNGTVTALEIHEGNLAIGGLYPGINNSPNIAFYNDVFGYSTPGTGGTNGAVSALRSDGGFLYVGGAFSTAGGMSTSRLARWNSANGWSLVAGGADASVVAMTSLNGEVHVGGTFDNVAGGNLNSPAWARYSETGTPWISQHPLPRAVNCDQSATFAVVPASGYAGLNYQWRKDGMPVSNGPTGHGSVIAGAQTAQLTISYVSGSDAGGYSCEVSNGCGSALSLAASLTLNNACCSPDVNNSGFVDVDDLITVIVGWGPCTNCAVCVGDINHSCTVDVDDLIAVIVGWGACP